MNSSATQVDASVVIPTIGRPQLLERCLASLDACRPAPREVIVVDQGKSAETAEVTRFQRAAARRYLRDEKKGAPSALNRGAGAAKGDLLLFTDDDCLVAPTWIETALKLHQLSPNTLFSGAVLPENDSPSVPSTKRELASRDFTGTAAWGAVYTGNMVVPRADFIAFGGFDERFAISAYDNDLSYRWLRSGRRLRYEPSLVVTHADLSKILIGKGIT